MTEVEQIYLNDFGVAFYWKKNNEVLLDKVQFVFKETGFYLSYDEIEYFGRIIGARCAELDCGTCCHRANCHKFLLKTPVEQIDLAVSKNELMRIKDLVEGTLFTIGLRDYVNRLCRN